MLLESEKRRQPSRMEDEDKRVSPIVKEITKMRMPHTESTGI